MSGIKLGIADFQMRDCLYSKVKDLIVTNYPKRDFLL
jgi:hypothetical protein